MSSELSKNNHKSSDASNKQLAQLNEVRTLQAELNRQPLKFKR